MHLIIHWTWHIDLCNQNWLLSPKCIWQLWLQSNVWGLSIQACFFWGKKGCLVAKCEKKKNQRLVSIPILQPKSSSLSWNFHYMNNHKSQIILVLVSTETICAIVSDQQTMMVNLKMASTRNLNFKDIKDKGYLW